MRHHTVRRLAAVLAVALAAPLFCLGASLDTLSKEMESAALSGEARAITEPFSVPVPDGELRLVRGTLFPGTVLDGTPREFVFLGETTLRYAPEDPLETQQLELFIQNPDVALDTDRAVFAIGDSALAAALAAAGSAATPAKSLRKKAEEEFAAWMASKGRSRARTPSLLLLAALQPNMDTPPFAAWLPTEAGVLGGKDELPGHLLVRIDPLEVRAFEIARLHPYELSIDDKKKYRRYLLNEFHSSALAGLYYPDGYWNVWSAQDLGTRHRDVEPKRYHIDVEIGRRGQDVGGSTRIELQTARDDTRSVVLNVSSSISVSSAKDDQGRSLSFSQHGSMVVVELAEAKAALSRHELVLEHGGKELMKRDSGDYAARTAVYWYPHAGRTDLAPYSMHYRYPKKLDLLGSGRIVNSGETKEGRWEERKLEFPCFGVGFRMGKFKMVRAKHNGVEITVASSRSTRWMADSDRQLLARQVIAAMHFLPQMFGKYPLDHLTVVTTDDEYSQGLLSFVTFTGRELSGGGLYYWYGFRDYRSVLAHELAHQWWGNMLVPESDRDAWLSEGIAEYASRTFSRIMLKREGFRMEDLMAILKRWRLRLDEDEIEEMLEKLNDGSYIDPLGSWSRDLGRTVRVGVDREDVGPLVLGQRLNSSVCNCYDDIVYVKGGKVVDMLAQQLGEDPFLSHLEYLVQNTPGMRISTEYFLEALAKLSRTNLDGFNQRYVYGRAVPIVEDPFFETGEEERARKKEEEEKEGGEREGEGESEEEEEDEEDEDVGSGPSVFQRVGGQWETTVTVKQRPARRQCPRFVRREDGRVDLGVKRFTVAEIEETPLSVPFKVLFEDEEREEYKGRIFIRGEESTVTIRVADEPKSLFLNSLGTTLARVVQPKKWEAYRLADAATEAWGDGDIDGALALIDSWREADQSVLSERERAYNHTRVLGLLATIHLDRGQIDEARSVLDEAEEHADAIFKGAWQRERLQTVEARWLRLSGRTKEAYEFLWKVTLNGENNRLDAWMMLALTAKEMGEERAYARAERVLRRSAVDLSLLR